MPASNTFFRFISNSRDFWKNVKLHIRFILIFSTLFFWVKLREILSVMYKDTEWSIRYSCHIITILEFFRETFEKYSHIIFPENPSSGSRVDLCRLTGVTNTVVLSAVLRRHIKIFYMYCIGKTLRKHFVSILTPRQNT